MATYKVTDTELNRITKILDKLTSKNVVDSIDWDQTSPSTDKAFDEAKKLSKEIKDKYTKIK